MESTKLVEEILNKIAELYKKEFKELCSVVRTMNWNRIYLSSKGYRGGIFLLKTTKSIKIPLFFYINQCIVIRDTYGIYSATELKEWLMDDYELEEDRVDLDNLLDIQGATLIASIDSTGKVAYNEEKMNELKLNTEENKEEIAQRLSALYKVGDYIEKNYYDIVSELPPPPID